MFQRIYSPTKSKGKKKVYDQKSSKPEITKVYKGKRSPNKSKK